MILALVLIVVGALSFAIGNAFGFSAGLNAEKDLHEQELRDGLYECGHCGAFNRWPRPPLQLLKEE